MYKKFAFPSPKFSRQWEYFFDDYLPKSIQERYFDKKRLPSQKIASSVEELSFYFQDLSEDECKPIPYLQNPKFRTAYFLYFMPLHAAKFVSLFQSIPKNQTCFQKVRILDLGSGPGTASIAFLLAHFDKIKPETEIEFYWWDQNLKILQESSEVLKKAWPELNIKIFTSTERSIPKTWKKLPMDWVLVGNFLNEFPNRLMSRFGQELLDFNFENLILIEPAFRKASQKLSQLRNEILEHDSSKNLKIYPCPHSETCPMTLGKNWCHFSIPADIPGKIFNELSKYLGNKRDWLKFSGIHLSKTIEKPLTTDPLLSLSDGIPAGSHQKVLFCKPNKIGVINLPLQKSNPVLRGQWIHKELNSSQKKLPSPKQIKPRI